MVQFYDERCWPTADGRMTEEVKLLIKLVTNICSGNVKTSIISLDPTVHFGNKLFITCSELKASIA